MGQLINDQSTSNDMFDIMEKAYKFSLIMAKSDIIPTHYRSKPENVFIAIQTAYKMHLDPMLVMQNTFVVSGKLGMNSTFAISLANSSGLFKSGIRYKVKGEGDSLRVTAYAILKIDEEEISYTIGMKEAIAENWTKNAKYKSLPELMLRYRAATLLIRTHVPEVINGMHMVEEIEDVVASKKTDKPREELISQIDQFLTVEKEPEVESKPENHLNSSYEQLSALIELHSLPESIINAWLEKASIEKLENLSEEHILKCIDFIQNKYQINQI